MMKRLLFSPLFILLPGQVLAAAGNSTGELLASGMRIIGAMVLVLGLMLVMYSLAKKRFRLLPGQRNGTIEVLEIRYLAPKKAVALVKVRGQELLLGMGTEQVNLLHKLDAGSSFEATLNQHLEEEV